MYKKALICCLTAALFYGCSKNNDAPPVQINFFGTWQYKTEIYSTYSGAQLDFSDTTQFTDQFVQFNSDGTGIDTYKDTQTNFTFTVKDKAIIRDFTTRNYKDTLTVRSVTATKLVAGRSFDYPSLDGTNTILSVVDDTYFDKVTK